jgi:hypothetical protein
VQQIRIANIFLGLLWLYQGLVPKIIFPNTGELDMLRLSGIFMGNEKKVVMIIGVIEIIFGLNLLLVKSKNLHYINIIALIILGIGAAFTMPSSYTFPFNPFSLNLSMIGLSVITLMNFKQAESSEPQ